MTRSCGSGGDSFALAGVAYALFTIAAVVAIVLGSALSGIFRVELFTSVVEGQTWPLALVATALFAGWAGATRGGARPRPFLRTATAAFALDALLIGVWAVWQGGVPEFSDSGFI